MSRRPPRRTLDGDLVEPTPRPYRPRRQRSRDMDWETARQFSRTVSCPAPPKGCRAPIGTTCRNPVSGDELVNQPAHDARMKRARAAEPDADQAAEPATEETNR